MLFLMLRQDQSMGKDAEIMEGSIVRGPLACAKTQYSKWGQKFMGQLL